MKDVIEESCRCPQCQFEAPMSEFKPKQYADKGAKIEIEIGEDETPSKEWLDPKG
jgi:hypothetical protein